jgi:hypothetical protein
MTQHNIVGKIRRCRISFDPILRLDENKNDARIIVLSVDIVRGLGMIGWHHFIKSTNGE